MLDGGEPSSIAGNANSGKSLLEGGTGCATYVRLRRDVVIAGARNECDSKDKESS